MTAKHRGAVLGAVSVLVLGIALCAADTPPAKPKGSDTVRSIVFEKKVYLDSLGRGAASCEQKKKSFMENVVKGVWKKTTGIFVDTYSIDGKYGPQIACMSKVPVTEFEVTSKAGIEATGKSIANMEEYKGRYREQLVIAPVYTAYIKERLREIYAYWPADAPKPAVMPEQVEIFIRNDDEPNAVSYIDNSMVVNTGLIDHLDEDAFLFALAHEYAHLAAQHPRKDQARLERRQFISQMAEVFNLLSFLFASDVKKTGENDYTNELDKQKYYKSLVRARAAQSAVIYANDRFVAPGWSRSLEDEADALAMDVLLNRDAARADLYMSYFSQQTAWDDVKKELQQKVMANFEANLKDALKAEKLASAAEKDDLGGWADYSSHYISGEVQKDLRGALASFLQRDHISDDARRKGIRKYVEAAYGGWPGDDLTQPAPVVLYNAAPTPEPKAAAKGKGKSSGKGSKPKRGMNSAQAANPHVSAQKSTEIANLKKLRASLAGFITATSSSDEPGTAKYLAEIRGNSASDQSYVNIELALYASGKGDIKSARSYFEKASNSPLAVPRIYLDYAAFALKNKDAATAAKLSVRGKEAFGDPDRFLAIDIAVARAAKDDKLVSELYMKCQRTGRDTLLGECENAYDPERDHKKVNQGTFLDNLVNGMGGLMGGKAKSGT